jgi:hypothetical protein
MYEKLAVRYPFDLRSSINEKNEIAMSNQCWTAFVNNAGTIVHLVPSVSYGETFFVRLKFVQPNLKGVANPHIRRRILKRVRPYIVF